MLTYLYNLATDRQGGVLAAIVKFLLFILSLLYGLIVRGMIILCLISRRRLPLKVISVGNITLGGTGKTALVELIARYLKKEGHRVAILSRGYGGGDEPDMLSGKLADIPVIVGKDRRSASNLAQAKFGADTVILDDGFQQWRIIKDADILTVDSLDPFGNRHMLPRGILREPLSSLKRADIIVLTKSDLCPDIDKLQNTVRSHNQSALILKSIHMPVGFYPINEPRNFLGSDSLKSKAVTLFSGIASPLSFEETIKKIGLRVGLSYKFRDHHQYTQEEINQIFSESRREGIDTVITTEKDAVRMRRLLIPQGQTSLLVLRIELRILEGEKDFYDRLLRLYPL